jgi:hypothetical protein
MWIDYLILPPARLVDPHFKAQLLIEDNEELHNLYSSPNIIRMIKSRRVRLAWHVAHMGEKQNAYRILVGKPEGKKPLGRPRRNWEDNIKMDLMRDRMG